MSKSVISSHDMLAAVAELVDRRIPQVYRQTAMVFGREPVVTKREFAAVALIHRLHDRYSAGHYHHTENEQSLVAELMAILVRRHAELRNLPPIPFVYDPTLMAAREPPRPGAYEAIRQKPVDLCQTTDG